MADRGRDAGGRPRQQRPRDSLGRPLPFGTPGVAPVPEDPLPLDRALTLAGELLAKGRPFGAHEVLEAAWKVAPEDERDLWQGLAQLCVSLTHAERGNAIGADRLLARAEERLAGCADVAARHRVDLGAVLTWARAALGDPARRSAPVGLPPAR